ncbi:MAG: succinate dehydrogenase/fumarate reductase cytochrome b subunit [Bacteroidaceae bacterium]|nr:succinate dehydrogenase/fumarate reductase cytochrome b subunit [Bacteroidaceae bacterium]
MWLINSSIGRKVVMSVTGIALVLFLTFHASMNVVALFSAKGYNMICEFLGANWYAVVATIGLAALVALHFIFAICLTLQNRKARGNNSYAVTNKPEKVEWASQNMRVLGIIVVLGLCLHLYNFWYNMMFAELFETEGAPMAANGVFHIMNTFHGKYGIIYTVIYLIWLCALWFHLTHGIWSSVQTLGWSGKIWFKRWRCISTVYATIVILMFAVVAVAFAAGYKPCDMKFGPGCPPAEFVMPNGDTCAPDGMMPPCPGKPGAPAHPKCPKGHHGMPHPAQPGE